MTLAPDRAVAAPSPAAPTGPADLRELATRELTTRELTTRELTTRELATAALQRARNHLLDLEQPAGWWKGELATNVTMDAEDLLLREFLGIRTAAETEQAARWIRSRQRADGTWANFEGGPADLSTTLEAYVALKLAGDDPADAHMRATVAFIRQRGGVERCRVFTRLWLALFGLWSWDDLPNLPPELIFLPRWFPFNVYDFACWARQTIVPLTIVATLRPVRPLAFGIDELRTGARPDRVAALPSWRGAFQRLDRVLHSYGRRPVRPLRRLAMRRAAEWIIARQEADGCWGGIQPPWVYSIMALHVLGYPLAHPVLQAGLRGLDGFLIHEDTPQGRVRRLEACQSPVWDTALAIVGLLDAGEPADSPALRRAADWLLGEEVAVTGDWAVRRPALAPGGWAFEFANDLYPDIDDTAEVGLALRRVAHPDTGRVSGALERARAWVIGMQSKDGGWGAFDADNTRELAYKLPFCDFGAAIDPPSADVTAHVVEFLAAEGLGASEACRTGVAWLLRHQEADGSWFGRWGANHVYGTGAVVPGLVKAGMSPSAPAIRRAVRWLESHQNDDGGWGEDLRSYTEPAWVGRGTSTASQTAWALLALLAAGESSAAVERGVRWLAGTQRPDGTWDEPQFTGTGFPGDFYINYHLYRLVFPVSALGRFVRGEHSGGGVMASDRTPALGELVVCTPLLAEYAAVRWGTRHAARTRILRTGMGPARSRRAASALSGTIAADLASGRAGQAATTVVVAGVAGALSSTLSPGDVIVARELLGGNRAMSVADAAGLADSLRGAGLPVQVGPVLSTPRLAAGDRTDLHATTGAIAVDMESAWLAEGLTGAAVPALRVVTVRVVVDTPTAPLLHPRTARNGVRALRVLTRVAAALPAWAAAWSAPRPAPAGA